MSIKTSKNLAVMKLTEKQIKDLKKAQTLILKALAIVEPIEGGTDLRYTMNALLTTTIKGAANSITDEMNNLGIYEC